ncbi:MAG: hypothetical protein QM790_10475 [Nibricoccus sp.]
MQLTLAQVVEHYRELRQAAYRDTEEVFGHLKVRLRGMTEADAAEADEWPNVHGVRCWSWLKGFPHYKKEPKRFDVAITVEGQLCALCVGLPTHGKLTLKLHVLEGLQVNNPIKGQVIKIVLVAAHAYAAYIGAIQVWLCNPLNETMVSKYQSAGYVPVRDKSGRVTHMTKET